MPHQHINNNKSYINIKKTFFYFYPKKIPFFFLSLSLQNGAAPEELIFTAAVQNSPDLDITSFPVDSIQSNLN